MKNLILVALILQLVIVTVSFNIGIRNPQRNVTHNYTFGDIIKFPRMCIRRSALYNHYAVYVGPETGVNVSQGENDIFHFGGLPIRCRFGHLERVRGISADSVSNYFDGVDNGEGGIFTPGTTEEIRARIIGLRHNCPGYNLRCNNCEHLATRVRYNISISMQVGAFSRRFLRNSNGRAILKQIQNHMTTQAECE